MPKRKPNSSSNETVIVDHDRPVNGVPANRDQLRAEITGRETGRRMIAAVSDPAHLDKVRATDHRAMRRAAVGIRQADPTLPKLPARAEDPLDGLNDLLEWCDAPVAQAIMDAGERRGATAEPDDPTAQPSIDAAITGEAKALAILVDHPDWTLESIADAVGCNLRTLHKWKRFKDARKLLKLDRERLPSGMKDADKGIEAWD